MQGEAKEEGRQRRQEEAWGGLTPHPVAPSQVKTRNCMYGTGPTSKEPSQGAEVLISLSSWKLILQWDLCFTLAAMGSRDSRASLSLSLCCPHVAHDHLSQSPSNLGQGHSPEPIASHRVYINLPQAAWPAAQASWGMP